MNVIVCSAFSNDTALFAQKLPSAPFGLTPKALARSRDSRPAAPEWSSRCT